MEDSLFLNCRDSDKYVEIYITEVQNKELKCIAHDILLGSYKDIKISQYSNEIKWIESGNPFMVCPCKTDYYKDPKEKAFINDLHFLKYLMSDPIKRNFSKKGYEMYLKDNIIGTWVADTFSITFNNDGTFISVGTARISTPFAGINHQGEWWISGNNLVVSRGYKKWISNFIVDLKNNSIYFPGYDNYLFFELRKK